MDIHMQIVHINLMQPVNGASGQIVDLFSRETRKLKAIYHHLKGDIHMQVTQFTGFIA